ncbi:hypothetical protein B0H14DRAFT_3614336 [Mycena olivaceomarginata]|nr:hypothetical protein B0H14DRAFT_3614336 [Mycena olivaceomarginata]
MRAVFYAHQRRRRAPPSFDTAPPPPVPLPRAPAPVPASLAPPSSAPPRSFRPATRCLDSRRASFPVPMLLPSRLSHPTLAGGNLASARTSRPVHLVLRVNPLPALPFYLPISLQPSFPVRPWGNVRPRGRRWNGARRATRYAATAGRASTAGSPSRAMLAGGGVVMPTPSPRTTTQASRSRARLHLGRRAGTVEPSPVFPNSGAELDDLEDERTQYVLIDYDIVLHAATQRKLRAYAAKWRGVSSRADSISARAGPYALRLLRPAASTASVPDVTIPVLFLHLTHVVAPHTLLARCPSLITPSSTYLCAPTNRYAHSPAGSVLRPRRWSGLPPLAAAPHIPFLIAHRTLDSLSGADISRDQQRRGSPHHTQ